MMLRTFCTFLILLSSINLSIAKVKWDKTTYSWDVAQPKIIKHKKRKIGHRLKLSAPVGSTVNPSIPAQNSALSSAPIRNNFQAAYNDINTIYGYITTPTTFLTGGSGITIASNGTISLSVNPYTLGIQFYDNTGNSNILAIPNVVGEILQSNGTNNPVFSSSTYPSTITQGQLLYASAANTIVGSSSPTLGISGTTTGCLNYAGGTSGTVQVCAQTVAGTPALLWPNVSGTILDTGQSGIITGTNIAASTITSSNIATNTITNNNLVQVNGQTLKGNNSASLGNDSDLTLSQVANLMADWIGPREPGGRITLTSGTPILTATVSGATTVYYTPYKSQFVPIWNGTYFVMTDVGGELSQATTDTTKSPAAVAVNSVYDIFVWYDSGTSTYRATRGPVWSSSLSRGYTLSKVQGVYVNPSAITNGPAAGYGTYVGTIASNASSTIDFIYGACASGGGTAGSFQLWNQYNRINVASYTCDSTAGGHTYSTNSYREYGGYTTMRTSFVLGNLENSIEAVISSQVNTVATATAESIIGLGVNATGISTGPSTSAYTNAASINIMAPSITQLIAPSNFNVGENSIYLLEEGDGTHLNTLIFGTLQISLSL